MGISTFGWNNNAPPAISAANLEQMLQDAGTYTDAETARAEAAEALLAPLANPHLTGIPTAPTAASGVNNTQIATTAFVTTAISESVAVAGLLPSGTAGLTYVPLGAQVISVKDPAYGASGNAMRIFDGVVASGSLNVLTTASWATFQPGMLVNILNASASLLSNVCFRAHVISSSSSGVVLDSNVTATVSGTQVDYGYNDGPAIQAALNAMSTDYGGGTVVFPPGNYLIDVNSHSGLPGQVTITGYHNETYGLLWPSHVHGWGYGAVLRCPANPLNFSDNVNCIGMENVRRITIEGLEFDGCAPNPSGQFEDSAIIMADNTTDVQIVRCYQHNFQGKGSWAMGAGLARIHIIDTLATALGQQFAQLSGVTGATVRGCICHDTSGGGAESLIIGGTNWAVVDDFQSWAWGTAVFIESGAVNHAEISHVRSDRDITVADTAAVLDLDIHDNEVTYISVGGGPLTQQVNIHHNYTSGINVSGGAGVTVSGVLIDSNYLSTTTYSGISASITGITAGASANTSNIVVSNNILDNGLQFQMRPGVVSVRGNLITGHDASISCNNAAIVGNSFQGGTTTAVTVAGTNNVFSGNVFSSTVAGQLIEVTGAGAIGNIFTNNQFLGTSNTAQVREESNVTGGNVYTNNYCTTAAGLPTFLFFGAPTSSVARNNVNLNPLGNKVVTVPASAATVSGVYYDRTFYITSQSTGTSVAVSSVGSSSTIALISGTVTNVLVPAQYTITPTYTVAPTWVVYGQ